MSGFVKIQRDSTLAHDTHETIKHRVRMSYMRDVYLYACAYIAVTHDITAVCRRWRWCKKLGSAVGWSWELLLPLCQPQQKSNLCCCSFLFDI